jgi:hypothetical protein
MYQIDNSTAALSQPAATGAGTPGFFTDGNPATSTPATIVPAEWLNAVMMELSNVVTGAGLTLSKPTYNQVLAAIKRLGQSTIILADTGAANAYTAVNSPPLVAGTWVDGVVQQVKIAHANTGASTYAPDGLTAIPIYGLGLQPLQGGELALNGTAVLMRATIAGVNSGNPIAVLMECAGGAQQTAPATQSQHAVQMGQTFSTVSRRVQGLIGNVNATTPLTKFDLSANAVVAVDASGRSYAKYGLSTTTVDLGLAGPAVNGRDQSAAFTASSFVHIYWIFNPTSVTWGLIGSAALPTVGPALPSGYTAWVYATTLNWNASSNIVPCFVEGAEVVYDLADAGVNRVLSGGAATTMTSVSCSGYVPPNAVRGLIIALLSMVGNVTPLVCYTRRTGSATTGQNVVSSSVQVNGQTGQSTNWVDMPMNSSQSFDYRVNVSPSSGGVSFEVRGYVVANGDC